MRLIDNIVVFFIKEGSDKLALLERSRVLSLTSLLGKREEVEQNDALNRALLQIEGLHDELVDANAGLIHELMMFSSDQAKWGCTISMTYFISTLESLSYFRIVIDKMVSRSFTMLSQDRSCSVQQTLILFHYFSILEAVLKYSPFYSNIIKSKYREEIRYYCNNPSSKILRASPIQELAISRIQSVIDEVTKPAH